MIKKGLINAKENETFSNGTAGRFLVPGRELLHHTPIPRLCVGL